MTEQTFKDKFPELTKDWILPTHGPCCTCQACGHDFDNCKCDINFEAVEKFCLSKQRVREAIDKVFPDRNIPWAAVHRKCKLLRELELEE